MNLIRFPNQPMRAIRVEPFDDDGKFWVATYAGDDWTASIEFKPVLPIGSLLPMLKEWKGRNGLPIVVVDISTKKEAA